MTIGDRIKRKRESLGITQTALADLIGMTKQNLYKYENGIVSNIPSDKVEALASALQTTPAYLMGWDRFTISRYASPNPIEMRDFAKNLKKYRTKRKLSLKELAERTDIREETLRNTKVERHDRFHF